MSIQRLLSEANLYDKAPLLAAIDSVLSNKGATSDVVRAWFARHYAANLMADTDHGQNFKRHVTVEGDPAWAANTVDFVTLSDQHKDEISHFVDYFNTLDGNSLRKIHKEPYATIAKKVADWDADLASRMDAKGTEVEGTDYVVLKRLSGGYMMVKLLSSAAYELEGDRMGHCVGDSEYFGKKSITILSLRDAKNNPHATLEVRGRNKIYQIKGKQNVAPVAKYASPIKEYVNSAGLKIVEDGENIGYVKYAGVYYDSGSSAWAQVYKEQIVPAQNKAISAVFEQVSDGVIAGDVKLTYLHLKELPDFSKITVHGDFLCNNNQLTSLQGAPASVGGDLYCYNNQLTSLQGAPASVGGNLYCSNNQLTSLQGAPASVGGNLYCYNNQLTSLQGAPASVGGNFGCTHNPGNFSKEEILKVVNRSNMREATSLTRLLQPL